MVHAYSSTGDVATQCGLFHGAKLIVGPHGAGFVNLLCARKGTPVIEFQQAQHAHDFELLTAKLGLPYIGIHTSIEHDWPGTVDLRTVHEGVEKSMQARPKGGGSSLCTRRCRAPSLWRRGGTRSE